MSQRDSRVAFNGNADNQKRCEIEIQKEHVSIKRLKSVRASQDSRYVSDGVFA